MLCLSLIPFTLSLFTITYNHAKSMGIRFDRYCENKFYTTYLMMVSDYKELGSELSFFVKMARAFLEDDDMTVSSSEKLCIYLYKIAMGE